MGLTLLIIAICMVFGVVAAVAAHGPVDLPELPKPFTRDDLRRFSPRKTLFVIGPAADHAACRLQRRLLKPAIALIIREDVTVIELYGDSAPRKNGEPIDWLDPALMRHALNAEEGFSVVYVDERGRTAFRSEAPMVATDVFRRAGIPVEPTAGIPRNGPHSRQSAILRKLRAA